MGTLHPYIYLFTQKQTFKNVQYESYHWPAGRWWGRIPCHIAQLVNYGLPSDDFVVSQVLRGDNPAASFDVPNDILSQRPVVEALGMIPYLLEGFRVLWVSDIVSKLSEVSFLIEQQLSKKDKQINKLTELYCNDSIHSWVALRSCTKSFSAFWPRVIWSESKNSTKQGVVGRERKRSLYGNACYEGYFIQCPISSECHLKIKRFPYRRCLVTLPYSYLDQ